MVSIKKNVHLLGLAPSSIALQLSFLRERFDECRFDIYKNIEVLNSPHVPINSEPFQFKIHPVGRFPESIDDLNDILLFGVPGPKAKENVFNYFSSSEVCKKQNYYIFIHPRAYVSPEAKIDAGVFIEPEVVISTQSVIEFGVTIKRGVLMGHHNHIGKFSEINPGVVLSSNVVVGNNTVIGSGTIVRDGVTIGANSMIGMGSNVISDVPDDSVAYGNPCRVMKKNKTSDNP
jgi:sugar O-acyltransferase (sialic acid O-acetyltransferase NeuD family)